MPHKDPAQRKAYQQAYRLKNREKLNADQRERDEALDRDKRRAYRRQRYAANAEKINEYNKTWNAANPERYAARRLRNRLKQRGLTIAQYEALHTSQEGKCAICHAPFPAAPHIDHCHSTGVVRGLLCSPCNLLLGHARDQPSRLQSAALYLERTTP